MRRRPSSRLLVLDPDDRLLLFRFVFRHGALAGREYWATPGGAVEAGETFAHAARRELFEETGIVLDAVDEAVAERSFVLQLADGELVMADERYFLVRTAIQAVSSDHRTTWEHEVMADHRWWSLGELAATRAVVFPEHVVELPASVGIRTETELNQAWRGIHRLPRASGGHSQHARRCVDTLGDRVDRCLPRFSVPLLVGPRLR